jgi:hypothetical protein
VAFGTRSWRFAADAERAEEQVAEAHHISDTLRDRLVRSGRIDLPAPADLSSTARTNTRPHEALSGAGCGRLEDLQKMRP